MKRLGPAPSGVRAWEAAPRGSGKTTVALLGMPLEVLAQGSHRFVVIVGSAQEEAEARLEIIRSELRRNPELAERYPRLRYVRRGNVNAKDQVREIHLVGGRIVALGAGVNPRGLVRPDPVTGEVLRPDLFLMDDLESPEQVRSKLRTDRLEEWIFADIASLGGPGEQATLDILGIGTTIDTDALATRAVERRGRFAGWQTARFPAERTDPETNERVAMWEGQPLRRLDPLITPGHELFIGELTYAREYLLAPQERADQVFRKKWFRYVQTPLTHDNKPRLAHLALGVDPAVSLRESASLSAAVLAGVDELGYTHVVSFWQGRFSMDDLFDRIEADYKRLQALVGFEAVQAFAWGVQELRKRQIRHRPIKPEADKVVRARPVALMYEAGHIVHDPSLEGSELEDQMIRFPDADHDDLVDALVYAVKLCSNNGQRVPRPRVA